MAILSTLAAASPATQLHVASVFVALALAPLQFLRKRRDAWHKRLGYIWVTAMAVAALSSLWISDIRHFGPFSAIHLISLWVLYALTQSIRAAKRGDINTHRQHMEGMALFGLIGAGTFTFLPYRMMNQIVFPDRPMLGFYIALTCGGAFFAWYYGRRLRLKLRPQ